MLLDAKRLYLVGRHVQATHKIGRPSRGYQPGCLPYTGETYVSNPTQEQPGGAPQNPYGQPGVPQQQPGQQPGFGAPQQPGFGAPQQGFAYAPPQQGNGLATAGLVLGILPGGIIGLIVSIFGLTRANKLGGVGKGKAWAGIILSIIWIAIYVIGGVAIAGNVSKRLDPACISAESYGQDFSTKIESDSDDPDAVKKDLQDAVTTLNADAKKSTNDTTRTAIEKLASDFQELLDDITNGTQPDPNLFTQVDADGAAVDTACGRS
jgi:hypothetical protein